MKVETVKCDECGIQKQEANHWFKACSGAIYFAIAPSTEILTMTTEVGVVLPANLDLCSEQCATKAMSKAIGARK